MNEMNEEERQKIEEEIKKRIEIEEKIKKEVTAERAKRIKEAEVEYKRWRRKKIFLFLFYMCLFFIGLVIIVSDAAVIGIIVCLLGLIGIIYSILKPAKKIKIYCHSCGYEGEAEKNRSEIVELILFLFGILPFLLYVIFVPEWRCPSCKHSIRI